MLSKAMAADNSTEQLQLLREEVLDEVIREAEVMIQAQFQSHLATDQRAFTFGGLTLTAATAALGAAIALSRADPPAMDLAGIAGIFSAGLAFAGGLAVLTALPRSICLPGNEPKNWKPEHWPTNATRDRKQARLEQAKVLQSQIGKNRRTAKRKAFGQLTRFAIAYLTCFGCGGWLARSLGWL